MYYLQHPKSILAFFIVFDVFTYMVVLKILNVFCSFFTNRLDLYLNNRLLQSPFRPRNMGYVTFKGG